MIHEDRVKEIFVALGLHFKGTYDYDKYGGSLNNITAKPDERYFVSLSRRLTNEERVFEFMLSNFINTWIKENKIETYARNFTNRDNFVVYEKWKRLTDNLNLNVHFDQRLNQYDDVRELIKVPEFSYPGLYHDFMNGTLSLEFIVCLSIVIPDLLDFWKKEVTDPVLFPNFIKVCSKYKPFLITRTNKENLKHSFMNHVNKKKGI